MLKTRKIQQHHHLQKKGRSDKMDYHIHLIEEDLKMRRDTMIEILGEDMMTQAIEEDMMIEIISTGTDSTEIDIMKTTDMEEEMMFTMTG